MKFAHVRASGHFTFAEQIFHREAISFARKGKFRCVPALWQVRCGEFFLFGAGDGNRTRVFGLGSGHSAIELHLLGALQL